MNDAAAARTWRRRGTFAFPSSWNWRNMGCSVQSWTPQHGRPDRLPRIRNSTIPEDTNPPSSLLWYNSLYVRKEHEFMSFLLFFFPFIPSLGLISFNRDSTSLVRSCRTPLFILHWISMGPDTLGSNVLLPPNDLVLVLATPQEAFWGGRVIHHQRS